MVINGPLAGDFRRNLVLLAVYFVAICTTIVIAAVPMVFRYITVCRYAELVKRFLAAKRNRIRALRQAQGELPVLQK